MEFPEHLKTQAMDAIQRSKPGCPFPPCDDAGDVGRRDPCRRDKHEALVALKRIERREQEANAPDPKQGHTMFPKIPRLDKNMVVTEKIDGTNAAIVIDTCKGNIYAQSRTRMITPQDDNFGFARFVAENAQELANGLGDGVHFGEWWGSGIQRGYGLTNGERRFSLFNTARWTSDFNSKAESQLTDDQARRGIHTMCNECLVCHVVPVLATHTFDTTVVEWARRTLMETGSVAAPGFDRPEGVVVYHTAANQLFKVSDAK